MLFLRLTTRKHILPLLCCLVLTSPAHSAEIALVGAAFIDLECWKKAAIDKVGREPEFFGYMTSLERFHLRKPISSMEVPAPPIASTSIPARPWTLAALLQSGAKFPDSYVGKLASCALTVEQLPTSKRLQAVEAANVELTAKVRHLEDNYQSAANITTDLVRRLTSAQERMSALEEELTRLRAQPSQQRSTAVNLER